MEMQKPRTEREKVCHVAHVLDEHYPPAFAQASLGLHKPSAPFRFTSQFMDRHQAKHHVGRFGGYGPCVVTRRYRAWGWREHRSRPANRRLSHLFVVKVIEELPLHVPEFVAQFRRGFIKSR